MEKQALIWAQEKQIAALSSQMYDLSQRVANIEAHLAATEEALSTGSISPEGRTNFPASNTGTQANILSRLREFLEGIFQPSSVARLALGAIAGAILLRKNAIRWILPNS